MDALLHRGLGKPLEVSLGNTHGTAPRRRLPRSQRERLIIEEAIRFFAEMGFEGQTRALAQRLGVTQPLLYRYFPDKEALIDRVYKEVFLNSWQADWNGIITNRAEALSDRVVRFYAAYTRAHFSYERVRLFMFAGLKGESIARRYMTHVTDNLFLPMCREIRAEAGLDESRPLLPQEIELVAGMHGAVGYVGLRRWVFGTLTPEHVDTVVEQLVRATMAGLPDAFRRLQ